MDYLIKEETLTDIADAIRSKTSSQSSIMVSDFATEIQNIPSGGSSASVERLMYVTYVGRDSQEIPTINTIDKDAQCDSYVSYDSSTKKFTVLQPFSALIVPWVAHYRDFGSSQGKGEFYINSVLQGKRYSVPYPGNTGMKDGIQLWADFSLGDTFWNYTPSSDGYPQQFLKMYICKNVPMQSDYFYFEDEEAN